MFTQLMPEEAVMMADATGTDLTAESIVVRCDVPKIFSWISNPALPQQARKTQ